jgi:hypothetical protein
VAGWDHADQGNRPHNRPHLSCSPPQSLAEPKPNNRTDDGTTPSHVVPATTVASRAQADEANSGQISALTIRACHHRGRLSPSRKTQQMPEPRSHMRCPPPQWFAVPTPTKRTEATEAPSYEVHANTVAACANADRVNRGQCSALTCRARHHSGWLSPCRPIDRGQSSALTYCAVTTRTV